MQKLEGLMRKAMTEYNMIEDGDNICVGVSGGKDSMALVTALGNMRRYYNKKFTLHALAIDPCFGGVPTDFTVLEEYLKSKDIPYTIRLSDIGSIVFEYRNEKNPCSLCANLRRGMLHSITKELGCNKIALGHHFDDAVETFYMNLWQNGRMASFEPTTWLSRKEITMIRPMIYASEGDIIRSVRRGNVPIVKSKCPVDGKTLRESTKEFVHSMQKKDPAFRQKMLNAFQTDNLKGWGLESKMNQK